MITRTLRRAGAAVAAVALALGVAVPSVADNGVPDPRYPNNQWASYDVATPGMTIADLQAAQCTAAFVARDGIGLNYMFTAGHCRQSGIDIVKYGDQESGRFHHLGAYIESQERDEPGKEVSFDTDYGVVALFPRQTVQPRIAAKYRVTKVYGASDLPVGTEVCKFGYRTEETCGAVTRVANGLVTVGLYSLPGDSGSPAYVKLGDDAVAAVGLLSGSPIIAGVVKDDITTFALIEPVLEARGYQLVTAG